MYETIRDKLIVHYASCADCDCGAYCWVCEARDTDCEHYYRLVHPCPVAQSLLTEVANLF